MTRALIAIIVGIVAIFAAGLLYGGVAPY